MGFLVFYFLVGITMVSVSFYIIERDGGKMFGDENEWGSFEKHDAQFGISIASAFWPIGLPIVIAKLLGARHRQGRI